MHRARSWGFPAERQVWNGQETKTEGVRKAWDKYKYVALVALVGAVLLLWPEWEARNGGGQRPPGTDGGRRPATVQAEMEDILCQDQRRGPGAGDADGGQRRRAAAGPGHGADSWQGSTAAPEDYSRSLRDGGGGRRTAGTTPVVTRTGVSHLPGGAGGVPGRGPGGGAPGGDGGGGGADGPFRRPHHGGKMAVIIWRRKRPMRAKTGNEMQWWPPWRCWCARRRH